MPASRRVEELHRIRRWTEADARAAVESLHESGLPAREFAVRHGLHPLRLARWAARLATGSAEKPRFVPVVVTGKASSALTVDVVLGARVLRVPIEIDGAELERLVRAVERA